MLAELKECFMEAYDDNQDGKIDIREVIKLSNLRIECSKDAGVNIRRIFPCQLAQLLPMEQNFLLLFRFDNPLDSSVEFMKVSNPVPRYRCPRPVIA
jgi:Ca2+-binding EF-hand superfamily protein